jgi:hypothetical protein
MNAKSLVQNFEENGAFTDKDLAEIQSNRLLRHELVEYFQHHRNRRFAFTLLEKLIELRKNQDVGIEDLMFASYLLGFHKNVADSLKIWEAKRIDYDSFCGFDIQLIVFAGIDETIEFLKEQNSEEGQMALKYILECKSDKVFDDLDEYYSEIWWV